MENGNALVDTCKWGGGGGGDKTIFDFDHVVKKCSEFYSFWKR